MAFRRPLFGAFAGAAQMAADRIRGRLRLVTLENAPDLRVVAAPGRGDRAVIVFNSLHAKMAGGSPAEFLGAASDGGARPVVFVTDPAQAWFQADGLADRITRIIGDYLGRSGARPRMTLGTSMGGYAAAVFAARLGAPAALAIGAQWDVGPGAKERRWPRERAAIRHFALGPAGGHIDGSARVITVHGLRDRWHARRFAGAPGVSAWVGPVRRHDIAGPMKEAGVLRPLIDAVFDGDEGRIARILADFGSERRWRAPGRRATKERAA